MPKKTSKSRLKEIAKNPCFRCPGGTDCADCLNSPENSTPVKLYTPKGAARAMLAGKVLNDTQGRNYFWDQSMAGFRYEAPEESGPLEDFSGLFEEL